MNSDKEILVEYYKKYTSAKKKSCLLVVTIVTAIVLLVLTVCSIGVYFGVFHTTDDITTL
jgi:flagellar basal body-associated protein FliL